jgi:ATP-binding cassette subfamily C protein LapB
VFSRLNPLVMRARAALGRDVVVATMCVNLVGLAMPIAVLQVYDRVLRSQSFATLSFLTLFVAVALALEFAFRILRGAVQASAGARFEHAEGRRLFAETLSGGERRGGAEAIDRFADLQRVKDFYFGPTAAAAIDLPFAAAALVLIVIIAGPLAVVPAALLVGVFALVWAASRRLARVVDEQRSADRRRSDFLFEVIGGMHTAKALALESGLSRRHERLQTASALATERVALVTGVAHAGTAFAAQSASAVIVASGAVMALNGQLTIGALAATSMLTGRMLQPVARAVSLWTRYQAVEQAQERLATETPAAAAVPAAPAADPRRTEAPQLYLDDVAYAHDADAGVALRGVTMMIPAGAMVGITGPTGAGKSTLFRLLAGVVSPTSGRIVVDGSETADIARWAPTLITGDGGLFAGTILENVALFRDGEFEERALRAIEAVGLADYIAGLPRGLDTLVGGGDLPSIPPGVAQRMMIARGLVDDSGLVLFDEANRSLDFESDARVLELLTSMRRRKTIIVATSRPSYLAACDAVYALEAGAARRVRGVGDPRPAAAKKGRAA